MVVLESAWYAMNAARDASGSLALARQNVRQLAGDILVDERRP